MQKMSTLLESTRKVSNEPLNKFLISMSFNEELQHGITIGLLQNDLAHSY